MRMDGTILGTDPQGIATIQMLHLDSALLNTQRKSLIDSFLDLYIVDLENEIASHLDETQTHLGEFFTMIEHLHTTGQL